MKLVSSLGLEVFTPKRKRYNETYKKIDYELKKDTKTRYSADKWSPIIEVVKLPNRGNSKSLLMVIVRNTPVLFDLAIQAKRPKDTFCIVLFTGLHQPTNHINHRAMNIISKFLKRKAFKLYRLDIAIDTYDTKPIDYNYKEVFKKHLEPFSKHGVMKPPNGATTLYIEEIEHDRIHKITYYCKSSKQEWKGQKGIPKNWKRLETMLIFDVTLKNSPNFVQYVESMLFQDEVMHLKVVDGYSD